MTIVLILAATAAAIAGVCLLAFPRRKAGGVAGTAEHAVEVRQAVRDLPVIDEEDTGSDPARNAALSQEEAVMIASEPDSVSEALATEEGRKRLAELGYEVEQPKDHDYETMMDAFEDGRGFFPAPETPWPGDESVPPELQ